MANNKSPDPFTDVDFPRTRTYGIAEHEVLMSFNGDSQAANFYEWWQKEGAFLFNDWLKQLK